MDIVREISQLYELSLAIGGQLTLTESSEQFLRVYMRQMNLDAGACWIRKNLLDPSAPINHFQRLHEQPPQFSTLETLPLPLDYEKNLAHLPGWIAESCTWANPSLDGLHGFLPIGSLGFLHVYYSSVNQAKASFSTLHFKKLEKVLQKLALDWNSILNHTRVITEQNARLALQKEAEKLALVAEKTDNAILITDPYGKIEWVNQGFVRLTGYTASEAIGKKPGSFLQGPDTSQDTVAEISAQLRAQKSFRTELVNYHKSGQPYWVEISIQPVYNTKGVLQYFIAIENNIDDRKQKEAELKEAWEKAQEGSRIKQEFLSVISHEIRTPLNAIAGMTDLLRQTHLTSQQAEFLQNIRLSSDNLKAIIDGIFDLSTLDAGELSIQSIPFNLKQMLQNIVLGNELKAEEKGVGLFLKFDPRAEVSLIGDPVRLSQVLLHLVSNAIKFTSIGRIQLELRLVTRMQNALVVEFIVEDTGKGIPSHLQEKIFDEFTQEDSSHSRRYGGTGVGLSISKKLVQLMGGELRLQSRVGHGTKVSFIIGFPLHEGQIDEIQVESQPPASQVLIGKKVLLVEDNAMNQFFARKLLEGWGIEVGLAENGIDAISKFNQRYFDLILMDIQMPEMDGLEATRRIRQENKIIPIIALTALTIKGESEKLLAAGFTDFMSKPFEAEVLQKKLLIHMVHNRRYALETEKSKATNGQPIFSTHLLRQMMKDNPEQVRRMELLFIDQAEKTIKEFAKGLLLQDWSAIAHEAHKIKASIDILQIHSLKRPIRALEAASRGDVSSDELIQHTTTIIRTLTDVTEQMRSLTV